MSINFDDHSVLSRHDQPSRMNYYTLERAGRRWTVGVPTDDFDRLGPIDDEAGKQQRREHLAKLLERAMQGAADGEIQ